MRVAAVLMLLVAVASGERWLLPRCDLARTGLSKNKGPKAKPAIHWQREEKGKIGTGAALVAGRLIYGAGEFVVACRRQGDGGMVWDAAVKQQVVAWPAVRDDAGVEASALADFGVKLLRELLRRLAEERGSIAHAALFCSAMAAYCRSSHSIRSLKTASRVGSW